MNVWFILFAVVAAIMAIIYLALLVLGKANISMSASLFKAGLYLVIAVGTTSELLFIAENNVTVLQTAIIIVSITETIANFLQFHYEYKSKKGKKG